MDLLLEIGTEELPPGEIDGALRVMADHIRTGAAAARLAIGEIDTYATPRRLALRISGVAERAESLEQTLTGPSVKVAFDDDGNPTRAAIGFARGRGVDPADLVRVDTDKGAYVAAVVRQEGGAAADILADLLSEAPARVTWKRAMRWGWSSTTFARPVHWIVALLDTDVLEVEFGGVRAGRQTRGHRFLAPEAIELATPGDYLGALRAANVIADVEERRSTIRTGVAALAAEHGWTVIADDDLVAEVAHLVEWPVPLLGHFEAELLELPREVLVTSMASHQRYFAVEDQAGDLANAFVFVSNMVVPKPKVVIDGNRRVLLARLEDARFFYREDRKRTLEERVESLGDIRYIEGLGTLRDRTDRIVRLASHLAEVLHPGDAALSTAVERAARLCKSDLTTGMVYEFPSLEGVMGRYYALAAGEPADVATAIEEHYRPKGAADAVAETPAGVLVALAEKLDAIAGCFAIGLVPTGSADPYGLRRAALGVLRTCLEHRLRLPLASTLAFAWEGLPPESIGTREETVGPALEFVESRLRAMLAADRPVDIVDAVVAVIGEDLPTAPTRVAVLDSMRAAADFEPLAIAFKRTVNIVRKAVDEDPTVFGAAGWDAAAVEPDHFETEAERTLWESVSAATPKVTGAVAAGDFEGTAATLISLKPSIDRFFDEVLVNVDDDTVRRNRLHLLATIRSLFLRFADISRIQVDRQSS